MKTPIIPRGSLGGKTSTQQVQTPKEADDTLHTTQYARFVDIVSEGPIVGLCDKNWNALTDPSSFGKGVFFNQVQLIADNNSPNFNGVGIDQRGGWPTDGYMPGFSTTDNTHNVGLEIKQNTPITVSITDSNTDYITVAVRIPRMAHQNNDGSIVGWNVTWEIWGSVNSSGYGKWSQVTINGKCSSDYIHATLIWLPKSATPGQDSWSVQVRRISGDDPDSKTTSQTFFDYFTETVAAKISYMYSAHIGVTLDASQLSSIPERGYRLKGRIISVPSNYFPLSRKYSRNPANGADTNAYQYWDGTFYSAWSDNPAWVYYDICTNARYGMGAFLATQIDKWSLYQIAQYCDQYVPDGYGRWEPRFTCNVYIQSQADAWKVITDLSSVFRGMSYWAGGTIQPVCDSPKDTLMNFANANVKDGVFSYTGTARNARPTATVVMWNDPTDFFNPKYEYVEDVVAIQKYGYKERSVAAFGCTSKSQARRLAKYMVVTDQVETETVTFVGGLDCTYLRPGDIIGIADQNRQGMKLCGRIKAWSNAPQPNITLDRPLDPIDPSGNWVNYVGWYIQVFVPRSYVEDDTSEITSETQLGVIRPSTVVQYTITGWSAANPSFITVSALLSGAMPPSAVWILTNPYVITPDLFRVLQVTEQEKGIYSVTAVSYNASKFAAIDKKQPVIVPPTSVIPPLTSVKPPIGLTATITPIARPEGYVLIIRLSWRSPPDPTIRRFIVQVSPPGDSNYYTIGETTATTFDYAYAVVGLYHFAVYTENQIGVISVPSVIAVNAEDKPQVPPHYISGLELKGQGNNTIFYTRDPQFDWRVNSTPYQQNMNSQETYGADSGSYDPLMKDFEVSITDWATGKTGWYEITTAPTYTFSYDKNVQAFGKATPKFTIHVVARDKYNIEGPAASLTVENLPPSAPANFEALAAFTYAFLNWDRISDPDAATYEIYKSHDTNFNNAIHVASIAHPANTYFDGGLSTGDLWYYWLFATDTFGLFSAPDGPARTLIGALDAQKDIKDFSIQASKFSVGFPVLELERWYDNTPGVGQISWNSHSLVFAGVEYPIAAGTAPVGYRYVWWKFGEGVYRVSVANPGNTAGLMGEKDLLIAYNEGGTVGTLWQSAPNFVGGSVYILDASIHNAMIVDLAVEKLVSGKIFSKDISLSGSGSLVHSDNFAYGASGWGIRGDGYAEFNNLTIRNVAIVGSTLYSPVIYSSVITSSRIIGGTIDIGTGNPSMHVDAAGNFWVGSSIFGNAPFSVDAYGHVSIRGSAFSGFYQGIWVSSIMNDLQPPVIQPGSGTSYDSWMYAFLYCDTPLADIYYTLDGSYPDPRTGHGSVVGTGAGVYLAAPGWTTLRCCSYKCGFVSPTASAGFLNTHGVTGTPTLNPPPGHIMPSAWIDESGTPDNQPAGLYLLVKVASSTAGATIRWAYDHMPVNINDGRPVTQTLPGPGSGHTSFIYVVANSTIYVKAFMSGLLDSNGTAGSYIYG
jgi:predicted phage tail protein